MGVFECRVQALQHAHYNTVIPVAEGERSSMRAIITAFIALSLSGCAAAIGGRIQNFSTTDTITLQSRPRDFVAAVEKVGAALNYDVAGIDRARNQVTLGTSPSMLTSLAIGKYGTFSMQVTLEPNGHTASIVTTAGGNYGQGDREKVEKRVSDFKTALSRELGGTPR